MKVFVVLCMSLALAASAAVEPKAVADEKVDAAAVPAEESAATGEKKHGKRGLFDFGYGFDSYGWGVPPVIVEKPVHYPVKVPVHVPVEKPVPVFIDRKVPVHVPVHIDRPVPYPVKVPVKIPVVHKVPYPVAVPKPYPVHVAHPVVVEKPVIAHDFGFGGHHFSNGWVGHHGFGASSYSGFALHH